MVVEHLEKELNRYVIATFDNPTNYLKANGNCNYSFIDNIQFATKFVRYEDALEVLYSIKYEIDLVILSLKIKYVLLEEGDE